MSHSPDVENRTQHIGRALYAAARAYSPSMEERLQDWLILQMSRDAALQSKMLRFIDALAALEFDRRGSYVKSLFREYFDAPFARSPAALRAALYLASRRVVPAPLMAAVTRKATRTMARRFITGRKPEEVRRTLKYLESQRRYPSFDVLGEQVLSRSEADRYRDRYLEMIQNMRSHAWSGQYTLSGVPRLQLSVKLTALTENFNPLCPDGTLQRVSPRLSAIAESCIASGIGLTIDAEEYEYRELTWHLFSSIFGPGGQFSRWDGVGMVVQAYHRDAESYLDTVLRFAEERATPFQVRLVKGAYWDYETIVASEKGWPAPVFTDKEQTDATYESLLEMLLKNHKLVRVAAGSHNIRSHAVAESLSESLGLPEGTVEHQSLFRTAEGISRGMSRMGWESRDYVPAGELVPGMAYLVRRVMENSSQAGFLMRSRLGEDVGALLRPPAPGTGPRSETAGPASGFRNVPPARLFLRGERAVFEEALKVTRGEWGKEYLLEVGHESLRSSTVVRSLSPSHPDIGQPVGVVHMAGALETERAIAAARKGFPDWAARRASDRALIVQNAARLLHAHRSEIAAWVVHEGGRTWVESLADVDEAIDHMTYNAEQLVNLEKLIEGGYRPRGVVAVIPPWNFPAALPLAMVSAAILTGNTVILKSAEQTPIIAARLVRLLHEAGVPEDVLVHLPGYGDAGKHLVESTEVDMVAFTGSKEVGKEIYQAASKVHTKSGIKKVVAEMGGKNPIVVFPDGDIDEAVRGILLSAFEHSNQKCSACSRAFVHTAIYTSLRERLKQAAMSLPVGVAEDPDTLLNPLIDQDSRERVLSYAAKARQEGRVLVDRLQDGGYGPQQAGPLIVELDPNTVDTSTIAREEIFGPILALVPFDSEEEMLAQVNGTPFALTAGIFSRSPRTIERMVRGIRAGNIYVNRKVTGARVGVEPFGGFQLSGTGPKAGGPDYLLAYLARMPGYVPGHPLAAITASPPPIAGLRTWTVPAETRRRILEAALGLLSARQAVDLNRGGNGACAEGTENRETWEGVLFTAGNVIGMAQEIADPQPTLTVPGQLNYIDWNTPRGVGLVATGPATTGERFCAMVLGPLLAGNGLLLAPDAHLMPMAQALAGALKSAGVPGECLLVAENGGAQAAVALADGPFHFVVADMDLSATRALYERLAITREDRGQKWLKALISMPDCLQPGELGFLRTFALPKTVAIRTLRHGADLQLVPAGSLSNWR